MVTESIQPKPLVDRRKHDDTISELSVNLLDHESADAIRYRELHRRMDAHQTSIAATHQLVTTIHADVRKHMEEEGVTLAAVAEDIRVTVKEPLEPLIQLVSDTEGFVRFSKRVVHLFAFVMKFLVLPILAVGGYLISEGWFI